MPEINYPEPTDPEFNSKVVTLLKQLFGTSESDFKTFNPISQPDVSNHGDVWFDGERLNMNINGVVRTLKFDP